MPGIARQNDIGAHGNILMGKSPNVYVNGLGVHRQNDFFVCPTHGVGVTVGNVSPTVYVNGTLVAKVGAIGIDGGGPVPVVVGSDNVQVP